MSHSEQSVAFLMIIGACFMLSVINLIRYMPGARKAGEDWLSVFVYFVTPVFLMASAILIIINTRKK